MGEVKKDLTGLKFGRLTVLSRAPNDQTRHVRWLCRCECGKEKVINRDALLSGATRSCGCYKKEVNSEPKPELRKGNTYDLSGNYGVGYTNNTNTKFIFDKDDYDLISQYTWGENSVGYIVTYTRLNKQRKVILLHRLIMENTFGNIDGYDIDHINHDIKNNTKENLRITEHKDNIKNSKLRCNNTSGVTGVSYNRKSQKWEAYITVDKKR